MSDAVYGMYDQLTIGFTDIAYLGLLVVVSTAGADEHLPSCKPCGLAAVACKPACRPCLWWPICPTSGCGVPYVFA